MPSPLDLSLSSITHDSMILSARKSPRMTLRLTPGYHGEKGPVSSTSARFSFNHLIRTPPPSPSLPALVPRHGKPMPSHTPQQFVRIFLWLCGVLSILYFGFCNMRANRAVPSVGWSTQDDQEYEMIEEDKLPGFPTPVVVSDKRGRAKWTVSIPADFAFPLEPEVYADICRQTVEVSSHVQDLHKYKHVTHAAHFAYQHVDPYFMDVAEAVELGMLPKANTRAAARTWEPTDGSTESLMVGEVVDELVGKEMCTTSMTFVMETYDAGLGPTLMMLWMAYGLAQKEGRAFFIDDTRWAYGNYSSLFKPPPVPNCRPPPRQEILPCPHHARHLLVSAETRRWTFGGAFNEAFEDPRKMEVFRQRPIFELARAGYEALFHLAEADSNYVKTRVATLHAKTTTEAPQAQDGITLGLHVRRGDRHPLEYQYSDAYIPLERFADKARDLLHKTFNASGSNGEEDMSAEMRSVLLVASDDPEVYESEALSHAARAQELIRLASNKIMTPPVLEPTGHPLFKRFIEETVGWEGGFFAGMFWNLGRSADIPSTEPPNPKLSPTPEAMRLRELVGRAYLLDLAVLGGASDAIICTVSSTGCTLLAVMMGWEASIEKQKWINIDGDFEWRGVSW